MCQPSKPLPSSIWEFLSLALPPISVKLDALGMGFRTMRNVVNSSALATSLDSLKRSSGMLEESLLPPSDELK